MMAIGRNTEGLSPLRFSTRDRAGGSAEEPDSESPLPNHSRWWLSCQDVQALRCDGRSAKVVSDDKDATASEEEVALRRVETTAVTT